MAVLIRNYADFFKYDLFNLKKYHNTLGSVNKI